MPTLHITRNAAFSVAAVLAVALSPTSSRGQANVNVTTWHNDNVRTGQNINETTLAARRNSPFFLWILYGQAGRPRT
jgi:hypothetical protein